MDKYEFINRIASDLSTFLGPRPHKTIERACRWDTIMVCNDHAVSFDHIYVQAADFYDLYEGWQMMRRYLPEASDDAVIVFGLPELPNGDNCRVFVDAVKEFTGTDYEPPEQQWDTVQLIRKYDIPFQVAEGIHFQTYPETEPRKTVRFDVVVGVQKKVQVA